MKNILLFIASIIISALLAETGMRIFTHFPVTQTSNRVHDSTLGYRFSTDLKDIDENGFRNNKGEKYHIAAIGDSHTYGVNVLAAKSWPSQLESMLSIGVYNFGVSSYGPFSYHAIIKTLLNPDTQGIIVGLYIANDFELKNAYCHINYANDPFWQKEVSSLQLKLHTVKHCKGRHLKTYIKNNRSLKKWLFENSAFLNAIDILVFPKIKQTLVREKNLRKYYYFPDGIDPTIMGKAKGHARSLDLHDLDVVAMYENMRKFIENWSAWSKSNGKKLGIMFIPSIERVVYEYFKSEDKLDSIDTEFIENVRMQIDMEKKISRLLDQNKILYKNALEKTLMAFQKSIHEGKEFYPHNGHRYNGHPLEDGYRAYAKTAFELWIEMSQK